MWRDPVVSRGRIKWNRRKNSAVVVHKYDQDVVVPSILRKYIPADQVDVAIGKIFSDFSRFGEDLGPLLQLTEEGSIVFQSTKARKKAAQITVNCIVRMHGHLRFVGLAGSSAVRELTEYLFRAKYEFCDSTVLERLNEAVSVVPINDRTLTTVVERVVSRSKLSRAQLRKLNRKFRRETAGWLRSLSTAVQRTVRRSYAALRELVFKNRE